MAVPKEKVSRARRDSRRASNWKVSAPNLVECSHCHEMKLPHKVCKKCGYYDGVEVINMEKDEKKAK